ncbi:DUF535 family protein [Dyella koreensis]
MVAPCQRGLVRHGRRASPEARVCHVHRSAFRRTSPSSSPALPRHAGWVRRRGATWFGSCRVHLLDLLSQHRFALTHLPPALFDAVYIRGTACLGTLPLRSRHDAMLSLCSLRTLGHVGALCLQLTDGEEVLYRIAMTVIDEGTALVITTDAAPWQRSRHATRRTLAHAMHGVRPHQLMCGLARVFARHYGMTCVLTGACERSPRDHRWPVLTDAHRAVGTSRDRIGNDGGKALPVFAGPAPLTANAHRRSASRRREALRATAEGLLVRALREAGSADPAPSHPPGMRGSSHAWRGIWIR